MGGRSWDRKRELRREIWSPDSANALMMIGLLGGVAVSTFSKTLAMLFGLLVFGVQVCRWAQQKKGQAMLM